MVRRGSSVRPACALEESESGAGRSNSRCRCRVVSVRGGVRRPRSRQCVSMRSFKSGSMGLRPVLTGRRPMSPIEPTERSLHCFSTLQGFRRQENNHSRAHWPTRGMAKASPPDRNSLRPAYLWRCYQLPAVNGAQASWGASGPRASGPMAKVRATDCTTRSTQLPLRRCERVRTKPCRSSSRTW